MANTENTTSRRALLAGLAALPGAAAAPAALAVEHDPIPALIEAHRAACAEMYAAKEARSVIEDPLPRHIDLLEQGAFESGSDIWRHQLDTVPGFREAVEHSSRSMDLEEEAFRALLCAAVNHPEGFMQLARYACEISEEEDGPALEDHLPAYRMLAAFAGLDCWSEPDGEMHPASRPADQTSGPSARCGSAYHEGVESFSILSRCS